MINMDFKEIPDMLLRELFYKINGTNWDKLTDSEFQERLATRDRILAELKRRGLL